MILIAHAIYFIVLDTPAKMRIFAACAGLMILQMTKSAWIQPQTAVLPVTCAAEDLNQLVIATERWLKARER